MAKKYTNQAKVNPIVSPSYENIMEIQFYNPILLPPEWLFVTIIVKGLYSLLNIYSYNLNGFYSGDKLYCFNESE